MSLEEVLCSKCSIKIVKILLQYSQLNLSEITQAIGTNHKIASMHLGKLVSAGVLLEKRYGKTRLYRFNEQSAKARAVLNLLQAW
jgi:predicted transcriptional regulator